MKESQWFVLYTKPRNEKKVADQLENSGFTVYCPLKKVEKQWSDRTKVIEEPLFSSYVFIKTSDADREKVFSFPGVVRYLFWLGKAAVVREEEIMELMSFMNDFDTHSLEIKSLTTNDRVKIKSGPLMGHQGRIEKVSTTKAILYLENLQCKITVNLTQTHLQKVG